MRSYGTPFFVLSQIIYKNMIRINDLQESIDDPDALGLTDWYDKNIINIIYTVNFFKGQSKFIRKTILQLIIILMKLLKLVVAKDPLLLLFIYWMIRGLD